MEKRNNLSPGWQWATVTALAALHPVLLYFLYPRLGEVSNLIVVFAPVVASLFFGWRIGWLFIPINVVATAIIFGQVFQFGNAADGYRKALVSAVLIAILCLGADKLRKYKLQRKMMLEELKRAKKMEALGRLAGGVAHDMNNTLNAIMGSVFAHRQELTAYGKSFRDLDNIAAACDRGAQLTQNLLGFARKSTTVNEVFSLNRIILSTELLLRRTVNRNIRIVTIPAQSDPFMEGDRGQIENAVMNLCLNSLDAMGDRGTLTLSTHISKSTVSLQVSDTGSGMDLSVQEHVFEPFFTTKEEGKGTGLGLAIVYGAVHAMKGKIRLESSPGLGTDITLSFPAKQAMDATTDTSEGTAAHLLDELVSLDGNTVLLIDDEPLVVRAGSRMMKSLGCDVLIAQSGVEGISLFKEHLDDITLVVLDLIMPDLDGFDTYERIREISTQVPVILVSGYTEDYERLRQFNDESLVTFLAKPYRAGKFGKVAKRLLEKNNQDESRISSA